MCYILYPLRHAIFSDHGSKIKITLHNPEFFGTTLKISSGLFLLSTLTPCSNFTNIHLKISEKPANDQNDGVQPSLIFLTGDSAQNT